MKIPDINKIRKLSDSHCSSEVDAETRAKSKEQAETMREKDRYVNKALARISRDIKSAARHGYVRSSTRIYKFNASPFCIDEFVTRLTDALNPRGYKIVNTSRGRETLFYYDYIEITVTWEKKEVKEVR